MAEYKPISPVDYMSGKLNQKDKTVFRQKFARDDKGAVIRPMKREVYVIMHPRDWKKNPAKGEEKVKIDKWTAACAKTKAILDDPTQRALWNERWKAQLEKGDGDSPIDPKTGKRKIYIKFDCYVRAKIWASL